MKNKLLRVLAIAFVVAVAALAFTACGSNEQSLEGMYIVTFELNGGVLDTGSTNATGKIYHAYYPDSKAIDISEKFSLTRAGYVFDGWCVDDKLTEDFSFNTVITKNMTLYARWKSAIVYSYTVYVQGIADPVGRYEVAAGDKFNDSNRFGTSLVSYDKTFLGYYSDRELTVEWDDSFTHPGGETSCDIPVYVKAMEGVWTFVSSYEELAAAATSNVNIWLTADINCQGNELYFGDSRGGSFSAKINGNKHVISNFSIAKKGTMTQPEYTLFGRLTSDASIYDIKFKEARFIIDPKPIQVVTEIKSSAFALSAEEGATISNVSIVGTYTNNTGKELSKINQVFYEDSTVVPTEFTATITEQNG